MGQYAAKGAGCDSKGELQYTMTPELKSGQKGRCEGDLSQAQLAISVKSAHLKATSHQLMAQGN